jgi:hypothetical protein
MNIEEGTARRLGEKIVGSKMPGKGVILAAKIRRTYASFKLR